MNKFNEKLNDIMKSKTYLEQDAPEAAPAQPETTPAQPMTQGDQSPATATKTADEEPWEWNVKQLVGILRYAGAMASGLRGGTPEEGMEVIKKVMKDLLDIGDELKQYITEEPEEEGEEEMPEEEEGTIEEPEEETIEEPAVNKTFKRE